MNTAALLVGLGPLIGWGLYPTVTSKFGGKPTNQIIGSTIGMLILGIAFSLFKSLSLPGGWSLILSILSGVGWAFGQITSFKAYALIGSSRVMPITTAFQLIATSLWGAFALGNWPGIANKTIGIFVLILIIIGATMTAWQEKSGKEESSSNMREAVILLLIGTIGYWAYSAAPQAAHVDGQHAFLPQAIGMLLTAIVYGLFNIKKQNVFKEKNSYVHIISGLFFAFGALTYLISAQPNMNGLATGFVLSQTSVIIATLTGVYFLGQKKTKKETIVTIIGLILIVASAAVTSSLN